MLSTLLSQFREDTPRILYINREDCTLWTMDSKGRYHEITRSRHNVALALEEYREGLEEQRKRCAEGRWRQDNF